MCYLSLLLSILLLSDEWSRDYSLSDWLDRASLWCSSNSSLDGFDGFASYFAGPYPFVFLTGCGVLRLFLTFVNWYAEFSLSTLSLCSSGQKYSLSSCLVNSSLQSSGVEK